MIIIILFFICIIVLNFYKKEYKKEIEDFEINNIEDDNERLLRILKQTMPRFFK